MRLRRRLSLLSLVPILCGLAGPALCQTTGDIEGTVSDSNGAALPGATVILSSPALQARPTTASDSTGRSRPGRIF